MPARFVLLSEHGDFPMRIVMAVSALVVSGALTAAAQQPQIGVSPPRVEVFLDEGPATGAVRLYNLGDERVGVRVSTGNWDLDEDNRLREQEPTEQSADQWLVVNPVQFTIEPGDAQVVRFAVRPRVEPTPGEHRAMIYFEQDESLLNTEVAGLRALFRIGVTVYAYSGEIQRVAVLHEIRVDEGPILVLDVGSEGNAHVRLLGTWGVWPADVYPGPEAASPVDPSGPPEAPIVAHGTLPEGPVLAGTRRNLVSSLPADLPPGDYVLDVDGSLSGLDVSRGLAFTVPAVLPDFEPEPEPEDHAADTPSDVQ
jgi:hypothetical protein